MVHALKLTRELVTNEGAVINIQPAGKPRPLEIHRAGEITRVGFVGHLLNYENHKLALGAVNQAVREGWFKREHERTIDFLYHASSYDAFAEWLAETSENSILEEQTARRAREMEKEIDGDYEVVMRESIYIGRLVPVSGA